MSAATYAGTTMQAAAEAEAEALPHPDGSAVESSGPAEEPWAALDPTTTAVVVVDVQRLFTDLLGVPVEPPLEPVLDATARFLADARSVGATVVLARTVIAPDEHSGNTSRWPEFMREQLVAGAPGTEFDPAAAPGPGDIEVVKRRYSAFLGTPLHGVLQERGIATVVVLGLTTNVCVQSTARDAWQLDYETVTLADCCAEVGDGSHLSSLAWSARNFGRVATSREVSARWRAHRSASG